MNTKAVQIFDEDGEPKFPLVHKFPMSIAKAIAATDKSLFEKSEEDLDHYVKPTYIDRMLKKAFWREFQESEKTNKQIKLTNITRGAMVSSGSLTSRINENPFYAAWLLAPAVEYTTALEGFIPEARKRYAELLDMDIRKFRNGEPTDDIDPKKAAILLSVIKNLEDRVIGGSVQRNVTISTTEPAMSKEEKSDLNMEAVEAKLKELEYQLGERHYNSNEDYIEAEVAESEPSSIYSND